MYDDLTDNADFSNTALYVVARAWRLYGLYIRTEAQPVTLTRHLQKWAQCTWDGDVGTW